jgi:hypothetical protein
MTPQEEQYVRDVLKFFYPDLTPPTTITQELGDLAGLMLSEAIEGSKAMNLVPRPAGFKPGLVWLLLQAVQIFWRTQGKTRIYEAVRRTVALKHRSEYEIDKINAA